MGNSIVRTDRWPLNPTPETKTYLEMTVAEYRSFCKALSYVVMGHWRKIASANSRCAAVETLIHKTNKNPHPTYSYFGTRFYKFPSYLRRAAIEFVCGQVSSFLTRYEQWQCGSRNRKDARPPQFTPDSGCYPVLYREQCIKIHRKPPRSPAPSGRGGTGAAIERGSIPPKLPGLVRLFFIVTCGNVRG